MIWIGCADMDMDKEKESSESASKSKRLQIGLLSLLFLLMLLCTVFMAIDAVQSVHDFQQQYNDVKAENVRAVRPWMTISVVSRVYHVPEDELCRALKIAKTDPLRRATLYEIASRKQRPVDQIVHTLQHAIQTYRHNHPHVTQHAHLSTLEHTGWSPTISTTSIQEETIV
jgi:hypothetical protein